MVHQFISSGICLARVLIPRFGGNFGKIIPRIFEINRQFFPPQGG
jgi:hypothetical protein